MNCDHCDSPTAAVTEVVTFDGRHKKICDICYSCLPMGWLSPADANFELGRVMARMHNSTIAMLRQMWRSM